MQTRNLFSSDTLHLILDTPDGQPDLPPAFVTFEAIVTDGQAERKAPFARSLVEKDGIAILHIVPTTPHWYHTADLDPLIGIARSHVVPETIAYGSSMGGYGAYRFADDLGVSRVIAMSPQASIRPEVVPFEYRWTDFAARISFRDDDVPRPRRALVYLLFDPCHEAEAAHARMIAQAGPTTQIRLPYAGHPVSHVLRETGLLSQMVRDIRLDEVPRDKFRQRFSLSWRRSARVFLHRGLAAKGEERGRLLHRAFVMRPRDPKMAYNWGIFLLMQGRFDEGHRVLRDRVFSVERFRDRWSQPYIKLCARLGLATVALDQ